MIFTVCNLHCVYLLFTLRATKFTIKSFSESITSVLNLTHFNQFSSWCADNTDSEMIALGLLTKEINISE